ncbi:hypothetical protein H1R20_g15101, partial [Candolleomyces eurysporus]
MSTDSIADEITQGTQVRQVEYVLCDGTVFFRAEDGQDIEGRSTGRPIVLEGYRAADFAALIKVLYPTIDDMIEGAWKLTKEDWVGVLNLSKRWGMKKIRNLAIAKLSDTTLSPMEKVVLAREYEVAKWLREGLNEIVSEYPIRPPAELKSQLGADTACTLMWIQNQALPAHLGTGFILSLGLLGCTSCQRAMFSNDRNCASCTQTISVNDRHALYFAPGASITGIVRTQHTLVRGPAPTDFVINLLDLMCRGCSNCAFTSGNYICPSCALSTGYQHFRLITSNSTIDIGISSQKILEEFGDEIARYESWDQ